jgi:hypothetical protein
MYAENDYERVGLLGNPLSGTIILYTYMYIHIYVYK